MLNSIGSFFGRKANPKAAPVLEEQPAFISPPHRETTEKRPAYSKVFRWRMPDGQTVPPQTVEIVGSFTHWQKVPLVRDSAVDAWHFTFHNIQAHKTHHYMLLVDGQPTHDRNSDGVVVPRTPEEQQFQIMTERGPRVFMLFAQTK
jgi:hypothetical protein